MLTILKIGIHVSMENLTQSFDAQHKTVQIHYLEGVALHHIRCRCKYIYFMLYGIHDPRPLIHITVYPDLRVLHHMKLQTLFIEGLGSCMPYNI